MVLWKAIHVVTNNYYINETKKKRANDCYGIWNRDLLDLQAKFNSKQFNAYADEYVLQTNLFF